MQESCTPGSTGGVPCEGHVYQPKPHAGICGGQASQGACLPDMQPFMKPLRRKEDEFMREPWGRGMDDSLQDLWAFCVFGAFGQNVMPLGTGRGTFCALCFGAAHDRISMGSNRKKKKKLEKRKKIMSKKSAFMRTSGGKLEREHREIQKYRTACVLAP